MALLPITESPGHSIILDNYSHNFEPYDHQREEFENHYDARVRSLPWEQGTGKTKPVIDSISKLYLEGRINALLVVAPNGVHRNWVSDEIPDHMPPEVRDQAKCHIWYSESTMLAKEKVRHDISFKRMMQHDGLKVLVMSYNGVMTDKGFNAWKKFLKDNTVFYVLDESHYVKTPDAKRSKRIMSSKKRGDYKRILTGTPIANHPFDVYNQLKFLDPYVWEELGIQNFAAFKSYFGEWIQQKTADNRSFPKCTGYKNLDVLKEIFGRYGKRIQKDDVLDLPPKVYSKRYFDMSPIQKKYYKTLKEDLLLNTGTYFIDATQPMVKLLRFQQVTCGYLPTPEKEMVEFEEKNRRLSLLEETLEENAGEPKAIIWARFTKDIDLIKGMLKDDALIIDGRVTGSDRGKALDAFQKGSLPVLIANPMALSAGVTLTKAKTVIYYSNSPNLTDRLQSEDRAHRIGLDHSVLYIDFIANDSVDLQWVDNLRKKRNVASLITGDILKDWI